MSDNPNIHTFVNSILEGDSLDTDIDEFAENWQSSDTNQSLAQSLGLTDDEYALWVEQPASLRPILHAKRHGIDLDDNINWKDAHLLAARSMSQGESSQIIEWLKAKGYIE